MSELRKPNIARAITKVTRFRVESINVFREFDSWFHPSVFRIEKRAGDPQSTGFHYPASWRQRTVSGSSGGRGQTTGKREWGSEQPFTDAGQRPGYGRKSQLFQSKG